MELNVFNHVDGFPGESDFELKTVSLVLSIEAGFKDVLVKNIYVSSPSTDPSVTVAPPPGLLPGQAVDAYGVGRVQLGSRWWYLKEIAGRRVGVPTVLPCRNTWNKWSDSLRGFFYVCKPKKGETIFVSAAAGSVGYIVGQYAKLFGCYVVGCAGSKQKVM